MGSSEETDILNAMSSFAKIEAVYQRASQARERAIAVLCDHGYDRSAVLRAVELLAVDPEREFSVSRQVSGLLAAMKAPVQLELVSLYETPICETPDSAREVARDAGFWARFCEEPRRCPAGVSCREGWLAGWDEAESLLQEKSPAGEGEA